MEDIDKYKLKAIEQRFLLLAKEKKSFLKGKYHQYDLAYSSNDLNEENNDLDENLILQIKKENSLSNNTMKKIIEQKKQKVQKKQKEK